MKNSLIDSAKDSSNIVIPVILSGGSGTRLWPQSRTTRPKQFISLASDQTLFELTLERLRQVTSELPIVVTNSDHRFLVAEHLRTSPYGSGSVILEPCSRNTAPAVTFAALQAVASNPDALLLVCPSDHEMNDIEGFKFSVESAIPLALENRIVTFGVVPDSPATGYGYIEVSEDDTSVINSFVEKPDSATANKFLDSGKHYWNSGIFLVRAKVILDEMAAHAAAIHTECVKSWSLRETHSGFISIPKAEFFKCPSQSFDYAVMEHTSHASMVSLKCKWSDMGTWESVWKSSEKDSNGNAFVGDVHQLDSSNNYVRAHTKLVALVDCESLVVIESGDSILVAKRNATDEIKRLVGELLAKNRKEATDHPRVYRPWGDYEGVVRGDRYQVKRIVVKPGEKLSLQKHYHRAEHWIVVRGIALITCGESEKLVSENQSTYIPLGETHRLENPGKIPLELIEVQSGSYLGEDDIVRLEDKYGRRKTDKPDATTCPETLTAKIG